MLELIITIFALSFPIWIGAAVFAYKKKRTILAIEFLFIAFVSLFFFYSVFMFKFKNDI